MTTDRKIFFIIGFPRSGTKLLRNILNNHDRIFVTGELKFLPYLLNNWEHYGDLSDIRNFRAMHRDILKSHYFQVRARQGIEPIQAVDWHRSCNAYDPLGVLLPLIRRETGAPESADIWLGDKSPNYTTHLRVIKQAIPEAKIVHIVRDIRDAALSARKIWKKNIFRFAQRWADSNRVLWRDLETIPAGDILELRYEDLITKPVDTLSRVTNFLALDFGDELLRLDKPSENFGDARDATGILAGNTQKYKTQMTRREQRKIESICGEVLAHYDYECADASANNRLPKMALAWYLVSDVFFRFLFDLRLGYSPRFIFRSMTAKARTRL